MRRFVIACCVLCLFAGFTRAADSQGTPYDLMVDQYMSGKWDDLETTLKARAKELAVLTGQQKADVAYIKQCMVDSHGPWWALTKAGKRVNFKATVWGRGLDLIFDPAIKNSVETKSNGFRTDILVQWASADMESAANAEHGFSKGELANLNVFSTLGMAAAWGQINASQLVGLDEKGKTNLFRAMDFRGNVTGVYYASPRGRQWGLWLFMHSYEAKYAKVSTVNGRKAVALAFMMELAANPTKYPSIPLPPADNEEKLALGIQKKIEKTGWTLAEDRAIREAMKTFATTNEGVWKAGGTVKLAGGLTIQLDPEADTTLRSKRDAWFKKAIEANKGGE